MTNQHSKTILFIHGNAVNSKIWDLVRHKFPSNYTIFSPDLRGYGKSEAHKIVHAENGVSDWVNDMLEFAKENKLNEVEVWGHSLGGNVLWGLLAEMPDWISKFVFISPGSPFGFGGTKNEMGELCFPDAAGSGGGMVHPAFVKNLRNKEIGAKKSPTDVLSVFKRLFFNQPSEEMLKNVAKLSFEMHLGEQAYPGDFEKSVNWPFVKPGKNGAVNALSPLYQKELIKKLSEKPKRVVPIQWVYGKQDEIVSNQSYADAGFLGKQGFIPNWPGNEVFPPQPMINQLKRMFELKRNQGFPISEYELDNCGHLPFLESEEFWEVVLT